MGQEIVALSSDLAALLDRFRRDQDKPANVSDLVEAALRQSLRTRGYATDAEYRPLRLTPDERSSGKADVSVEHDRCLYEAPG